MNIAFFTESYHPIINGVVISVDTFRQELTKLGHKVYIFAPSSPNYKDKNPDVFRFKSFSYPVNTDYRFPIPQPNILNIFKKLNIDIVHSHTPFFVGTIALSLAKKYKIPSVFTHHTQYSEYTHYIPLPQPPLKRAVHLWLKIYCNWCNWIIAPSEKIKKLILSYAVKTPISVIPTGINLDEFNNLTPKFAQKKYGIKETETLLMFAGRLAKEKNIPFIVNVFKLILEQEKNTHLLIVGGGPEENNLKKEAEKLGISEKITFTSYVPKSEVLNCAFSSDIFIFSSLTETQGLAILEAMAAGCPIVALDSFGVSEAVENEKEGFLCPNDYFYFRDKVVQLIRDKSLREKMANLARIKASFFSSSNSTKNLLEIFQKITK